MSDFSNLQARVKEVMVLDAIGVQLHLNESQIPQYPYLMGIM